MHFCQKGLKTMEYFFVWIIIIFYGNRPRFGQKKNSKLLALPSSQDSPASVSSSPSSTVSSTSSAKVCGLECLVICVNALWRLAELLASVEIIRVAIAISVFENVIYNFGMVKAFNEHIFVRVWRNTDIFSNADLWTTFVANIISGVHFSIVYFCMG